MKNWTVVPLVALVFFAGLSPLGAETWNGSASFTDTKSHLKTTVGGGLKFETDFHRFEFGGKTSLAANGTVKNTSDKKLYGALYIAFFDKDKNLVGSTARTIFLEPGKSLVAAYVVEAPADAIDKIASYQITMYEGEKEIGTK